jgi:hypothetical protein
VQSPLAAASPGSLRGLVERRQWSAFSRSPRAFPSRMPNPERDTGRPLGQAAHRAAEALPTCLSCPGIHEISQTGQDARGARTSALPRVVEVDAHHELLGSDRQ